MKYVAAICVVLALSSTIYGQQSSGIGPRAATASEVQHNTEVMVELQIFEVSLTKLQQMGFDVVRLGLDPARQAGDFNTKPNGDQPSGGVKSFSAINDRSELPQTLETLRKDNLVRVLAAPRLLVLSGKTASIVSGSELKVPKPQKDGSVTIGYQRAAKMEVTPEVLGDEVTLSLHGQFSEADYSHMVRVGKEDIPGVQSREVRTLMKLKSGQAFAFGGLRQVCTQATVSGVPWIGEIPFVGAMFRSVKETRNETAMFILIRPEIVQSPATAIHPAANLAR
jgi:pilus assembly protein CpaC